MKTIIKSCFNIFLCLLLLSSVVVPAFASVNETEKRIAALAENIHAVTVYDLSEDKLIYSKNADEKISVASTTKLVTSLVALDVLGPDRVLTVGTEISLIKPNSSVSFIAKGHRLKLRTLIAAMLLPSGNDAAYTVAVNTARVHSGNNKLSDTEAVKYFCNLMNEYVRTLGCNNTFFVNPEGWDDINHYSTASDMTRVAKAAANNAIIASIANIHSNKFYFTSGENITWTNSNLLLNPDSKYYYEYAHGLKTGTTNSAGKCLVAFAEKEKRQLLILAYGAKTDDDRFGRVRDIFETVYSAPEPVVPFYGDLNKSGDITSEDARLALRAAVGLENKTSEIIKRGDVDRDNDITAADARIILRAAVGLEEIRQD
ncbi:MAG: D-alanyl-D-alanine carboxypeptidase [Clostridia bacterium]|nr:D-alanyl-D-alanine carboxypeptidase [Clostridia bacterium]